MTEAEWLSCHDVEPLLHELWSRHPNMEWNDRKPSLLFCACCASVCPALRPEFGRFFSCLERSADDPSLNSESSRAFEQLEEAVVNQGDASTLVFSIGYGDLGLACDVAAKLLAHASGQTPSTSQFQRILAEERHRQAECVRDIFGNPFRPPAMHPGWITPKLIDLAGAIYERRAFERMPELAAALTQGGCDNEDIIHHCIRAGVHVRGCWVLDLLLGRDLFGPLG